MINGKNGRRLRRGGACTRLTGTLVFTWTGPGAVVLLGPAGASNDDSSLEQRHLFAIHLGKVDVAGMGSEHGGPFYLINLFGEFG